MNGGRSRTADRLPRLCAITDRALARKASHETIVRELLDGGARWIQLREKSLPPRTFWEQARAAVELCRERGALVVVNDRADLALASGADGVHVGAGDLPPDAARLVVGGDGIVGVSTHSVEEALFAESLPVDYVAIGPVFPTASKPDASPAVGLAAVRRLAPSLSHPLVAIGGIDRRCLRSVLDAGARSAAVVAALYEPGRSIGRNVEELLRIAGDD